MPFAASAWTAAKACGRCAGCPMTIPCRCSRRAPRRNWARKDRAAARHAAERTCAGRLPDHAPVAERLSHPVPARRASTPKASRPARAWATLKDGAPVRCAGVVLVRQCPGEGNTVFITLSDETGICNVVIWERIFRQLPQGSDGRAPAAGGRQGAEKPRRGDPSDGRTLIDRSADLQHLSGEAVPRHRPAIAIRAMCGSCRPRAIFTDY